MDRIKNSAIRKCSPENFSGLVAKSDSLAAVLRHFGIVYTGGSAKVAKQRIRELNLDCSHFDSGKARRAESIRSAIKAIPLDLIMIQQSSYSRGSLKQRLLREGLLENKCAICGLLPEWNGKTLVLRLDHENGKNNDNRQENLRLVCPNCDSQLETFSGRNRRKRINRCADCQKPVAGNKTTRCASCTNKETHRLGKTTKIRWPTLIELENMIASSNRFQVSKRLGVSDTAVRKMLERMKKNVT